jgi:SAM-dependent methyltransferase
MATTPATMAEDYGLDAPILVRNLALAGLACTMLVAVILYFGWPLPHLALNVLFAVGLVCFLEAGLMIWTSKAGKQRESERLLDAAALRGDETVLDVGCGRGLLLVGAARRLPHGKAVGLDVGCGEGDSILEAPLGNARAAGVVDRVDVQSGDLQRMPFADASFDAAVSGLALHRIRDRAGRVTAVQEIARVLRPHGRAVLLDVRGTREYEKTLRALGWTDVQRTGWRFGMFPPVRWVVARKPD